MNKTITLGGKLPSMIFYGHCMNEIETVSLAIAERADLLPIKITPKLVPKLRRYTQSESYVRALQELLNTVTVDTLQKRLVIIDDLTGLAKKDHAYLAKVVASATKGSAIFLAHHDTQTPRALRQSIPQIDFSFSINHRADTHDDIRQQCTQLLSSIGMTVDENKIQHDIESVYPCWTALADKTMLKYFPTTNLKKILPRKRKPAFTNIGNNNCGGYLSHSFDKHYSPIIT